MLNEIWKQQLRIIWIIEALIKCYPPVKKIKNWAEIDSSFIIGLPLKASVINWIMSCMLVFVLDRLLWTSCVKFLVKNSWISRRNIFVLKSFGSNDDSSNLIDPLQFNKSLSINFVIWWTSLIFASQLSLRIDAAIDPARNFPKSSLVSIKRQFRLEFRLSSWFKKLFAQPRKFRCCVFTLDLVNILFL